MALPKIALLFHPQIKLFHFSVPQMVFSDLLPDTKLFELFVLQTENLDHAPIRLHTDGGLDRLAEMDMVIVAGWHDIDEAPKAELKTALTQAYERGATLVGLCYGAYVLAYCGLLDGKRATTHWAGEKDFSERFPKVLLDSNALYIDDERLITSAGTASSLDCCLYIVRKFYGSRIANKIARLLVVPPHREGGQAQFIDTPMAISHQDNAISRLLSVIVADVAKDYRIDDLAKQLAMSRRTFTRHFQKTTGSSFGQWLTIQRLAKSLELLENTTLPIEQIAEQVGFHNIVSFRTHFRERYGVSPSGWRRQFQVA